MVTIKSGVATNATRQKSKDKRLTKSNVLNAVLGNENGRAYLTTIRLAGKSKLSLLDAVVPPGTFLEILVREVSRETDLPVEIALGVFMSQLSAAMAQNGVTVSWEDDQKHPAEMSMWITVLAPSGAGKTLLRNLVCEVLGLSINELPEPGSASAFLGSLSGLGGTALWCRDEYGQLIKQIKDGGPLAQLRGHLLQAYDHGKLESNTIKNGQTIIEHPVLSIFGATVDSTFKSCVDAEMLSDGLLARHLFVVAQRREMTVPRYPLAEMVNTISASSSAQTLRAQVHQEKKYIISLESGKCYEQLWRDVAKNIGGVIDPAYFRRTTWSILQYAAIYHLLLGETGPIINPTSIRWAWRMVLLHMQYAREALILCDSGFVVRYEKMFGWVEEQAASGQDIRSPCFARRLLSQFRHDLKSATEARQLVDYVSYFVQKQP